MTGDVSGLIGWNVDRRCTGWTAAFGIGSPPRTATARRWMVADGWPMEERGVVGKARGVREAQAGLGEIVCVRCRSSGTLRRDGLADKGGERNDLLSEE
jgi:hypothetical protein